MGVSIEDIKKLKELTGVGLTDAKVALVAADGDFDKALEEMRKKGLTKAEKKGDRETREGVIDSYVHSNRIGVVVEVNCETDFVARNEEFKAFAHEVAMQIASMNPGSVDELYEQPYIKDSSKTIRDLRNDLVQKIGENIQIRRFIRYELGGE